MGVRVVEVVSEGSETGIPEGRVRLEGGETISAAIAF